MSNMGYNYSEYKAISFTASEQEYWIGTAGGTKFRAEEILFYATQDCYVRFGSDAGVQHLIPNGVYITSYRKCTRIFVQRVSADGTLHLWPEGNVNA